MATTFDFEELQIPEFGESALFYGQATLKDNGDGSFYVDEIRLNNGHIVYERGPSLLDQEIFKAICQVIYDDRIPSDLTVTHGCKAASEWSDAVSERKAA